MGDLQYKYNNCIVPNTTGGGFLVEPVDSYNIAVVGVSSENKFLSKIYPITISKIDINAFEMNNTQRITFDSTHCRNLVDLEYFPTVNKLGVLTNLSDNTRGELLFVDMAKTSAYTSSRLWRANNLFNSITESNNGNFEILCSPVLMFAYNAHVLLENLNIYKNSQCSSNQNIYVSSSSISKEPTRQDKPFNKYERNVNWSYVSTELHETSVTIYCANYYK
jgi:hypothetical protein